MENFDYDALLNELDGIDHSPLQPWMQNKENLAYDTQPIPLFTTNVKQETASRCNSAPLDRGDVEDEIDGLLGDLVKKHGKFEDGSEGSNAAISIEKPVSIKPAFGGMSTIPNFAPRLIPKVCPVKITMGCSEEQGLRPTMEDKSVAYPRFNPKYIESSLQGPRSLAAVFDGHNGRQVADMAAAKLPALLQDQPWYSSPMAPAEEAVRRFVEQAFEQVDRELLEGASKGEVVGGCTAILALLLEDLVFVANLGDARCVLCRGGQAVPLSVDHKPNHPKERARIEAAGGRVELRGCWRVMVAAGPGGPSRGLAVSRALGDADWKVPMGLVEWRPETTWERLQPADEFLILACDGVWDVLTDQEAADLARPLLAGRDDAAEAAARALTREALSRGSADNVSALVVRLHW